MVRALERAGWAQDRQKGSHVVMVREGREETLSIPLHGEMRKGTIRQILRQAGLSVDEFVALL